MAWQIEHSADSNASPAAVWERYVDVDNWSEWSQKGVERSEIDGPFEVGTKGKSKAPGFPEGSFRLIAVGSRITHRVSVDGPLSFIYAPLVRRPVEKGLPSGIERLAEIAAEDQDSAEGESSTDHESATPT